MRALGGLSIAVKLTRTLIWHDDITGEGELVPSPANFRRGILFRMDTAFVSRKPSHFIPSPNMSIENG